MQFYVTERLGPKRRRTPEGFLLCLDVPVARTGIMDYLETELPGIEGERGIIRVERTPEEVFATEAVASAAGKPLVNDHPDEDVTPANWRTLAMGTMFNPHRGEGNLSDVLLADILVTTDECIAAIESGKVEISLGYDAEYEQIKPGLARQHNIRINHCALVDDGRCGPRCSIGDHAISVTLERQMAKAIVKKPLSFKDRIMAAFKAKDEAAIEKLAGEVTEDEEIADPAVTGSSANGITINVHGNSGAPAAEKATADEDEGDKDDPMKKVTDALEGITKALGELSGRMDAYDKAATADADGDDDDDDTDLTADADGDDDKDKDGKTKDGKGTTRDSSGLAKAFQDTLARAEILSPGIKVPTFDAKADAKKTRDALCSFRRKALDKAYATDEGKAVIEPLLGGKTFDTKKLTCDAASMLFTAASETMKAANRAANVGSGRIRANDTGTVKVPTLADMNKSMSAFWKK